VVTGEKIVTHQRPQIYKTAAAACLVVLLGVLPRPAASHPHVWADYSVKAVFQEEGLAGFRLQWFFDELFSSEIMRMYDLKGGALSPAQLLAVKEGAFDSLRGFNYFTQVWIDGREFPVRFVRDFTARIMNRRLVYEFFVPCTVAAVHHPKTVRIQNSDPEFFVDFSIARSLSVGVLSAPGLLVEHEILESRPRSIQIRFRKSP